MAGNAVVTPLPEPCQEVAAQIPIPRAFVDLASGQCGRIVDRLNALLRERFGPHLQVGPSHFMKKDLDEAVLRRVWDYDVMPFLEDQLFGQEEELARFRLERLRGSEHADHNAEGTPAEPRTPDDE